MERNEEKKRKNKKKRIRKILRNYVYKINATSLLTIII